MQFWDEVPYSSSPLAISLVGRTFGRLQVIAFLGRSRDKGRGAVWRCVCECGTEKPIRGGCLVSGGTRSCGCLRDELCRLRTKTHGCRHTRLYRIFIGVIDRCENSNSPIYPYYGERGITICDSWRDDFTAFKDWAMANGYDDKLTLDRKNNDGNYEPSNCRWITRKEQARNRSSNCHISAFGETKLLCDWGKDIRCKVASSTVKARIDRGWNTEDAITTPARHPKGIR